MRGKVCLLLLLIIASYLLFGQDVPQLLRIQEPEAGAGAKVLLVNSKDLDAILAGFNLPEITAYVEIADATGVVCSRLGTWKKGKTKWNFKSAGDFLLADFVDPGYGQVLEKVRGKIAQTDFQIVLSDPKTQSIIKSCDIVFAQYPDLTVKLKYPLKVEPGQAMGDELAVTVENKGNLAAENFTVHLVLSSDMQIPLAVNPVAKNFQEDAVLENGEIVVPLLKPGESQELRFSGPVSIPADIAPGKYYLGAVLDSERRIGELREDNNVDSGYILIFVPAPKRFFVKMPDTVLVFHPQNYGVQIVCQGAIFSDGKDWKMCRMKPSIYQFKHVNWKEEIYWEVDTVNREIWEIRGGQFCKAGGGKAKALGIKVEVKGGSATAMPAQFTLKLADTKLEYEPETRKIRVLSYGQAIDYLPWWRGCRLEQHLYQLQYNFWTDFVWEVNTFKKQVTQISGTELCKPGGNPSNLPLTVEVEN